MTAEPRDDLHGLVEEIVMAPGWREELRAAVAAADRENAELRGEVERLHRRLFPSQGENYANEVERKRVVIDTMRDAIASRTAERDDLRAQLAAAERDRDEARSERDDAGLLWGRHYNDAMGALETQLAAAQAQLAEVQSALARGHARLGEVKNEAFLEGGRAESEKRRAEAAEGRLEAVRAWVAKAEPYPDLNGNKFAGLRAALSAAPQPEPERCPCATPGGALYLDNLRRLSPSRRTIAAAEAACTCGQHRLTWPEPPASDEPTGRSD